MSYYEEGFPWIKFFILCVPLSSAMFYFAPTLKWKLTFALVAVPIGVGFALAGKSINLRRRR